jgi:two-component system cell cycle response regulator
MRHALWLLSELRSRIGTRKARIIVVFPPADIDSLAPLTEAGMAYDLGADDVLLNGFDDVEALLKIRLHLRRKRAEDQRHRSLEAGIRMATRDPLTGVYNRRYALPRLDRMLADSGETDSSFALLALDLDRFKAVNDTYGHAAGDAVLCEVSERVASALRPRDLFARYGGEEFLIGLPDTGSARAHRIAEGICEAIRTNPISLKEQRAMVRVTASIGIAVAEGAIGHAHQSIDRMMRRADQALYRAKADGRNTVNSGVQAA